MNDINSIENIIPFHSTQLYLLFVFFYSAQTSLYLYMWGSYQFIIVSVSLIEEQTTYTALHRVAEHTHMKLWIHIQW